MAYYSQPLYLGYAPLRRKGTLPVCVREKGRVDAGNDGECGTARPRAPIPNEGRGGIRSSFGRAPDRRGGGVISPRGVVDGRRRTAEKRADIARARTAPAENTCAHPPRARSLSEGLHDVVVVSRCSSGAHRGGVECASHHAPPPDKARPPLPRPPHPPLIGIAPYPRPSCLPPPPPIPFLREAENPPRDAVSE